MHRKVKPLSWLPQDRCAKANQSSQLQPLQRPTKMPTVQKHTSDPSTTLGWINCFLLPDLQSETDSSQWIFFKCHSICGAPSQACHLKNHLSSARDIFLSVVTLFTSLLSYTSLPMKAYAANVEILYSGLCVLLYKPLMNDECPQASC